jgi:hypothetical protein
LLLKADEARAEDDGENETPIAGEVEEEVESEDAEVSEEVAEEVDDDDDRDGGGSSVLTSGAGPPASAEEVVLKTEEVPTTKSKVVPGLVLWRHLKTASDKFPLRNRATTRRITCGGGCGGGGCGGENSRGGTVNKKRFLLKGRVDH